MQTGFRMPKPPDIILCSLNAVGLLTGSLPDTRYLYDCEYLNASTEIEDYKELFTDRIHGEIIPQ